MVLLGLGAGLSPFFHGFYNSTVWVWIGLGLLAAVLAGALAQPPRLTLPTALAVGGLAGLGVWTLISSGWSESANAATVNGNRWLVLAALLGLVVTLLTSESRGGVLVGAVGAGTLAVAVSILIRLLGHDPASLFAAGRLTAPLGYPNGLGCALAIGLWPCVALAEDRRPPLAGVGAAGATLLACLTVLTQSRGTAAALLLASVVTLALVPGRRRRAFLLLFVLAAIVISWQTLLGVYHAAAANRPILQPSRDAAGVAIFAALGTGAAWTVVVGMAEWVSGRSAAAGRRLRMLATAGLVAIVIAGVGVAAVKAGSIGHQVHVQYDAFVHLSLPTASPSAGFGRLVSGGGTRYDIWRVAWKAFLKHPVAGLGGGGFEPDWYARRRVAEDVHQPHSIELQALSETGIIAGIAVLLFVAGVALGAWRMRRAARDSRLSRACMVAATGAALSWFVQTSVDWIHLLPGVTAGALGMIGVLLRDREPKPAPAAAPASSAPEPRRRDALRVAAMLIAAVAIVLVILAGASLGRQGLADLYRSNGQTALAADPAEALRDANRSLRIDPDAVNSYYLRAAALARFNQPVAAEQTLREALRREPENWVTWSLLGDLEVRTKHLAPAAAAYRAAFRLNPLNTTLRAAAQNPRLAAQGAGG